jgi:hypothetical protein
MDQIFLAHAFINPHVNTGADGFPGKLVFHVILSNDYTVNIYFLIYQSRCNVALFKQPLTNIMHNPAELLRLS